MLLVARTKMTRISKDLDSYLDSMAARLSGEIGKPITKTQASQFLADEIGLRQQNIQRLKKKKGGKADYGWGSGFIRL